MKFTNIVFTRNRPLQLEGYLESVYRFVPRQNVQICILYKEDLFGEQYEEVFKKFDYCLVVRERDFNHDFLQILAQVNTEYMNFGTDDVVYFDFVDLNVIETAFKTFDREIFGFSMRMNPQSIKESRINSFKINGQSIYSVNWKKTEDKTARYPFELNGTIYKTELVREIVSHISSDKVVLKSIFAKGSLRIRILNKLFSMKNYLILLEAFKNPNSLEGHCYRWIKTHKLKYPKKLLFQKLCCSAIQVNIVNTVVNNPIDGGEEYTVESLNEKFKQGYRFDVDFMIKNKPRQTHIGKDNFQLR